MIQSINKTINCLKFVSFDELVSTSDAITIHAPLTPETDNLFDKDVLSRMKNTVI